MTTMESLYIILLIYNKLLLAIEQMCSRFFQSIIPSIQVATAYNSCKKNMKITVLRCETPVRWGIGFNTVESVP